MHIVGEPYNESYNYYSSDDESDNYNKLSNNSSSRGFQVKEEKYFFGKELQYPDPNLTSINDNRSNTLDSDISKRHQSERNFKNNLILTKESRSGCETVKNLKINLEEKKSKKSTSSEKFSHIKTTREIEILED